MHVTARESLKTETYDGDHVAVDDKSQLRGNATCHFKRKDQNLNPRKI